MYFFTDNSAKFIGCQHWNLLLYFYNGGNASGAAAPGEIPGEILALFTIRTISEPLAHH